MALVLILYSDIDTITVNTAEDADLYTKKLCLQAVRTSLAIIRGLKANGAQVSQRFDNYMFSSHSKTFPEYLTECCSAQTSTTPEAAHV